MSKLYKIVITLIELIISLSLILFLILIFYYALHYYSPNYEYYISYILGIGGIILAIYSELRNKYVSKKIFDIDKKIFSNLYSFEDTHTAIENIINNNDKGNYTIAKKDNVFLMAYWLWFGIDEEWHNKADIKSIRVSQVYSKIQDRINTVRARNSKTIIIIYDTVAYKETLLFLIGGIVLNRAKELNISFKEKELKEIIDSIFRKYNLALDAIVDSAKNSKNNGDEIILSKSNIPNIMFAKELNNNNYGVVFLGEIEFLNINTKEIKDRSFKKDYLKSSEFFGFRTYELAMVKSIIKQIYLIKHRC